MSVFDDGSWRYRDFGHDIDEKDVATRVEVLRFDLAKVRKQQFPNNPELWPQPLIWDGGTGALKVLANWKSSDEALFQPNTLTFIDRLGRNQFQRFAIGYNIPGAIAGEAIQIANTPQELINLFKRNQGFYGDLTWPGYKFGAVAYRYAADGRRHWTVELGSHPLDNLTG